MSSKKYPKMISSLNNNIHQGPNEMLGYAFDLKSDPVDISSKDNAASTFVEPTTKEKLRYLRYFRLVTHRKRNGMYIIYFELY